MKGISKYGLAETIATFIVKEQFLIIGWKNV